MFWARKGITNVPDNNWNGEEKAEDNPERKFFAVGLPHAGSYGPVEGLCARENYYIKDYSLIKYLRTIPGMA